MTTPSKPNRPAHHANSSGTQFQNPWDESSDETGTVPVTDSHSNLNTSTSKPESPLNRLRVKLGGWNLDNLPVTVLDQPKPGSESGQELESSRPDPGTSRNPSRTLSLPNLSDLSSKLSLNLTLNLNLPSFPFELATSHPNHPHPPIRVVKPTFGLDTSSQKQAGSETVVKATWLGHASFLLEFSSPHTTTTTTPRILFDPIFSSRAGPSQWTGIRRRLPPPCTLEDLPPFQYVVFSHNHYDHLDLPTIHSILALPSAPQIHFLVPLGNKPWFESLFIPSSQISELDWWDERTFTIHTGDSSASSGSSGSLSSSSSTTRTRERNKTLELSFTCTPAQHTSGRSLYDSNTTLWASWVVELFSHEKLPASTSTSTSASTSISPTATNTNPPTNTETETGTKPEPRTRTRTRTRTTRLAAAYYAGDTGYTLPSQFQSPSQSPTPDSNSQNPNPTPTPNPIFKQISQTHGPLDLSMIPIWRGGTLSFIARLGLRLLDTQTLSSLHATPSQALAIHQDIRSRHSIAMHFATFAGSDIEAFDPIVHLIRERELAGIGDWDEEGGFGIINVGETAQVIAQSKHAEDI